MGGFTEKIPLTHDDVESLGVSSLALARARKFLEALQEHDFLCLVADEETHQVHAFTKGDHLTINALAKLAETAVKEGTHAD